VLASHNAHKLRELGGMLDAHELVPLPDDVALPPEMGKTFEQNALLKAEAAARATGLAAIADDSGIAAAALGGAPGIRSARFAGENATDEENLAKLLREVDGAADRSASYVCAIAYVEPGGERRVFVASCHGRLASEPRGSGGFGYDPAFLPDEHAGEGHTMAELDQAEKDRISHRGKAARALAGWLGERP